MQDGKLKSEERVEKGFMDQNVRNRLWEIAGREQVYEQEPMSRHTTFRIGGPADFFVAPADMEALAGW